MDLIRRSASIGCKAACAGCARRTIALWVRKRPSGFRTGVLGIGIVFLIVVTVLLRRHHALKCSGGAGAHLHQPPTEEGPWRELVKQRLLKVPSDSRALLTVIVAAGVLVLAAAGIIGAGAHLPVVTVLVRASLTGPQVLRISEAALTLGVVCAAIAWVMVLAGLFLAHWIVRLVGLLALAGGALAERHDLPQSSIFHATSGIVALFGILLTGLFTIAADLWAQRRTHRTGLRASRWIYLIIAANALCVAIAYIGQAVRLAPYGSFITGSAFELELLNIAEILLIPMLLIAGADIADIAWEIGKGIQESLHKKSTVILLVASAGVAVVGVTIAVCALGAQIFLDVVLAAALIGLIATIVAMTRPYSGWTRSFPALAAAAIIFWFVPEIQIATGVQKVPPPSPAIQTPGEQDSALLDHFAARTGVIWIVLAGAGTLLLLWRRHRDRPVNATTEDIKTKAGNIKQAVLFMVTVGAWIALIFSTRDLAIINAAGHGVLRLEIGGIQALAGAATLGYVAALVRCLASARHRPCGRLEKERLLEKQQAILEKISNLFGLDCSLLLIWGAAILYGKAADVGEAVAILGSVVVVLALAWDFMFSGEMLNEGKADSPMPQCARILAYMGYLLLTISVVLQLGTLRSATTGAYIGVFSLERLVEVGIVTFGVPLAITLFLVNWFRQESPGQPQATGQANAAATSGLRNDRDQPELSSGRSGRSCFGRVVGTTVPQTGQGPPFTQARYRPL